MSVPSILDQSSSPQALVAPLYRPSTPTPSTQLLQRRWQQRVNANRARPIWRLRPCPLSELGGVLFELGGPAPVAAESAYSQLDYTNTVARAAAATQSAFRHHYCRCSSGSGGSGNCCISTPMPSLAALLQRRRQHQVNTNRPRPVLLGL
jgi:hypothetical protein